MTEEKTILPLSRLGFYQVLLALGWIFCLGYGLFLVLRVISVFSALPLPLPGPWFFLECLGLFFMLAVFLRDNHQQVAELYAEQSQFDKALLHFRWAMRLNPWRVEPMVQTANLLSDANQWDLAQNFFERALRKKEDHIDALNGLAFAHLYQHDWKSACALFQRAYFLKRGSGLNQNAVSQKQAYITGQNESKSPELKPHKLQHDIEQLSYLMALEPDLSEELTEIISKFEQAQDAAQRKSSFVDEFADKITATYLHNLYFQAPGAQDGKPLLNVSPTAEKAFQEQRLAVVDQALKPEVVDALYQFCLKSTIWHDQHYSNGYLGSNLDDGFACPLVFQVAEQLRKDYPGIFKDYPLVYAWAFKCDSKGTGVALHGDSAMINVNFWVTPDAANLNLDSGGLIVYTAPPPKEWDFREQRVSEQELEAFAQKQQASKEVVSYRQNRMVIFDSQYLHQSDEYTFKEGYENRRINITLLFGKKTLRYF